MSHVTCISTGIGILPELELTKFGWNWNLNLTGIFSIHVYYTYTCHENDDPLSSLRVCRLKFKFMRILRFLLSKNESICVGDKKLTNKCSVLVYSIHFMNSEIYIITVNLSNAIPN